MRLFPYREWDWKSGQGRVEDEDEDEDDIIAGRPGQHKSQNGNKWWCFIKNKQREHPRNNRDVANDTIETVWFQQGFPTCFHPTRRDAGVILVKPAVWFWPNVRATPMRLVRKTAKAGAKRDRKQRRSEATSMSVLVVLAAQSGCMARPYRPERQRRNHRPTTTTHKLKGGGFDQTGSHFTPCRQHPTAPLKRHKHQTANFHIPPPSRAKHSCQHRPSTKSTNYVHRYTTIKEHHLSHNKGLGGSKRLPSRVAQTNQRRVQQGLVIKVHPGLSNLTRASSDKSNT